MSAPKKAKPTKKETTDYSGYTNGKLAESLRGELNLHQLNAEAAREKVLEAVLRLEQSDASEGRIKEMKILKAKLAESEAKLKKIQAVLAGG